MFLLKYFKNLYNNEKNTENKFYYLSLIKEKNNQFSIHGLWPQYSLNSYPSYCKEVQFDIDKVKYLLPELNKYWYSNRSNNDDFWKHEYQKHGSCVFSPITEEQYFKKTLDLYKEAINKNLPEKYFDSNTNKCLIPLDLNFHFKL